MACQLGLACNWMDNLSVMRQFLRLLFVTALLMAPGIGTGVVQAQQALTRIYTSTRGKALPQQGVNVNYRTFCTNPADPCNLAQILERGSQFDTQFAILVDGPGAFVEIRQSFTVLHRLDFQFYTNDGIPTANETGTLKFSGNLTINAGKSIWSTSNNVALIITSNTLSIAGGSSLPGRIALSEPGRRVRITQPNNATCMSFDDLTIAGRTQITPAACAGTRDDPESVVNITNSLTVNGYLQLLGDNAVLNVTSAPAESDLRKAFLEVNSPDGSIGSIGGKLRLAVSGFTEPAFDAKDEAKIYEGKTCFEVRGNGPIELDLEVMVPQYICVSVPRIGASDTSRIHAGSVNFGETVIDGNLVNAGTARTQFSGPLSLKGDLLIDGRWIMATNFVPGDDGPLRRAILGGTSNNQLWYWLRPSDWWRDNHWTIDGGRINQLLDPPIFAINAFDESEIDPRDHDKIKECFPERRPGVHLYTGSRIEGGVRIITIYEQIKPGYSEEQPEIRDEDGNIIQSAIRTGLYAVPCQSGLFLHDNGLTKVQGEFKAVSEAAVLWDVNYPDTWAGGYVYLGRNNEGFHNLVLEGDLDIASTRTWIDMAAPATDASLNGCSTPIASGASGNKLIFGGSNYQAVKFSTDILPYRTHHDFIYPAIDRTLYLGALSIDKSGGAVEFETGAAGVSVGYLEPLSGVLHTGSFVSDGSLLDASTVTIMGDGGVLEVQGSASVYRTSPSTVVYAGGNQTVGAERGEAGTVTILSSGVVTMPKASVTNLNLYAGTLRVTDELAVTGTLDVGNTGKLDLSGGALKHTGTLMYSGNVERNAGGAWPASAEKAAVTDKRDIKINQVCGGNVTGLEVNLASGYTPVGGDLTITRGALDLSGGALVAEPRTESDTLTITIAKDGELKDSGSGAGLMLGYVPAENATAATTKVELTEAKSLPSVEVIGGKVEFNANNKALTVPSMSVDGGSKTEVTVVANVLPLHVGDLTVSSGKLVLQTSEVSNHMQTGGTVTLGSGSYTVTDALSISGKGAHLAQGADVKVLVKGDVTVDSGATLGIPATVAAAWEFSGDTLQTVSSRAPLGHVVINSSGGVMLADDLKQNDSATLTLQSGQIHTGDSAWVLLNPNIEADLAVRSAIPADAAGTVKLGSRASFFTGRVSRTVSQGNTGSGNAKGGYLFPLGTVSETAGGLNRYRPLILNYSADVSPALTATASLSSDEVTWPATGLASPSVGGGTMVLDTYSSIIWKVELSEIPLFGATVRVAADGLVGVNNPNGLRLVQWDCDGTNARVAGDFESDWTLGLDDSSVSVNGRISGVPNTTMDGVELGECNLIGIAANHAENPIGDDGTTGRRRWRMSS